MLIGAPAGAAFGFAQFLANRSSVGGAIFGGIFFALFFGAAMARILWKRWPGAKDLSSTDRVTVSRVVRRGENIDDPRLAPAVLDYAAVVSRTQKREHRDRWVLWIFAGLTLILAMGETLVGPTRGAVFWWVLVVLWVGLLVWLPRKRARTLSHASQAATAASRLLG
jgi:hypothetical protein